MISNKEVLLTQELAEDQATSVPKEQIKGWRFPAHGTPARIQADYANRLLALAEITGKSMIDHLDTCRSLVLLYRLHDINALQAVEAMNGYTWTSLGYKPCQEGEQAQ